MADSALSIEVDWKIRCSSVHRLRFRQGRPEDPLQLLQQKLILSLILLSDLGLPIHLNFKIAILFYQRLVLILELIKLDLSICHPFLLACTPVLGLSQSFSHHPYFVFELISFGSELFFL